MMGWASSNEDKAMSYNGRCVLSQSTYNEAHIKHVRF